MISRLIVALFLAGTLASCGVPETASSTATQAPVHSPSAAPAPSDPPTAQPITTAVVAATMPAPTTAPYPIPQPTPRPSSTLRGTISYPAELALAPDVSITIQLLEVRAKEIPSPIVNQPISPTGPGPIPFTLEYDPTRIDPQWEYVVSAEVHDLQGQLLFVTPWFPVLTQGHPATAEVVLQAPGILRGTVSYPAQPALPPDAVLFVQLVNQSLCGVFGGCHILGEQRITPSEQSPTSFALAYNSAIIDPQSSYVVIARMGAYENPKEPNWWTEQPAPVLTQGQPATVELMVAPRTVAEISGTISYPAQPALPPDAVLTVQLLSLTETGVFGPPVMNEQTIPLDGPGSKSFTLAYDPAVIDPLWSYAIDAKISAPGRLDWRAEQPSRVLTQGHPTTVEVAVEAPPAVAAVSGTVTYPAQAALPADAVLTIQLADIKNQFPVALGTVRISPVGPGPIPFTLEYDPTRIDPQEEYGVYAMLHAGGKGYFIMTTPNPVITQGHTNTVDVVLQAPTTATAVSGTITYQAQGPLPPDAVLVVQVEGWTGDDVAQPLGEQIITPVGPGPIPFAVDVPVDLPTYGYSVRAMIYAGPDRGGRFLFTGGGQGVLPYVPTDMTLEAVQCCINGNAAETISGALASRTAL